MFVSSKSILLGFILIYTSGKQNAQGYWICVYSHTMDFNITIIITFFVIITIPIINIFIITIVIMIVCHYHPRQE